MLAFYMSLVSSDEERSLVEFLYNNYKQTMFKTAMGILHNECDAEDAVHDAFLRIIKNIEKFRAYSCRENTVYVVMIVKGISLNMLKKNSKTAELPEDTPDPDSVEETVEQKLGYDDIKEEIASLSPALKPVASLHFIEGLPAAEIAELLDMQPGSVYSSITRARRIIVSSLNEKEKRAPK